MKRIVVCSLLAATSIALSSFVHAQSQGMGGMDMKGMDMKMEKGSPKKGQTKTHHVVGTVKSVDAAKRTVTVDHQPVATMNWPAMAMTFKAKDKKMLEQFKPGAKVEFYFQERGKDYVITKVE